MRELFLQNFEMLFRYVPTNVYVGLLMLFCLSVIFCFFINDAKKRWNFLSKILLAEYLFLVYSTTVLFRKYSESRGHCFRPFWSYEAIGNGQEFFIAENVMNVVGFVPVGVLLGCAFKSMTWWKVLMMGSGVSTTIEVLQFYYKRGFAEIDDVMHNIIGCFIGYGIYSLVRYMHEWLNNFRDKRNNRLKRVLRTTENDMGIITGWRF